MVEKKRAVVAGWNGFIGHRLVADLTTQGYEVVRVGRSGPEGTWDDPAGLAALVDGADVVINLAGKSVGCRYTDANRNEILRSRVETTRAINQAIAAASVPPRLWLNASTATIYRYALDHGQTESNGEQGDGFSTDIARAWEDELFAGDLPGTRRVALRMAIVLGGPATDMLALATKVGLGGTQYDGPWFQHRRYRGIGAHPSGGPAPMHRSKGRQKFSWIHIDDVVSAVRFISDRDEIEGPVNLATHATSDNTTLMAELRRATGRKIGLPAYRWMLEIGMLVLRQETELVLKSRWVLPETLTDAGFEFAWPELGPALDDALRRS